jgi:predicted phosphoribosyltransferase
LQPEYAKRAETHNGHVEMQPQEASQHDPDWLRQATAAALDEARRRSALLAGGRERVPVKGKIAIVVDDGLATGWSLRAAVREIRRREPERIVAAVPVGAPETVHAIGSEVDDIVVLDVPQGRFTSVGAFYWNFDQVSDDEVAAIMKSAAHVQDDDPERREPAERKFPRENK